MSESYANLTTDEESIGLNGLKIVDFPWKIKKITITNDSNQFNLSWQFREANDWATLRPNESVSMELSINSLRLISNGATYRVWGIG